MQEWNEEIIMVERQKGYFNSTSKRIEERIEVITREAEDVNDFTTDDRYFNIPTVISPISTVLHIITSYKE